jgi:hypothetical protein
MSCTPTGPINIQHLGTDKMNNCFKKCYLEYDFKITEVNSSNKGDYISIKLNDNNVGAKFSSTNTSLCQNGGESSLVVEEIRIYRDSLHTYGSNEQKTNAEVIIVLNNSTGGKNAVICIPISTKNGTLPSAGNQLTNIIRYVSKIGIQPGEGGVVKGLNFRLNSFIPKDKGFYHYVASLPWDPCEKCADYIVYNMTDAVIYIDNSTMSILNSLINKHNIVNMGNNIDTNKLGYSYNKRGAILGFGNNDNIWISCHPTGTDGKILVDESKSGVLSNNAFGMFSGIDQDTYEKWRDILIMIVALVGIVVLMYFSIFALPGLIDGGTKERIVSSATRFKSGVKSGGRRFLSKM